MQLFYLVSVFYVTCIYNLPLLVFFRAPVLSVTSFLLYCVCVCFSVCVSERVYVCVCVVS